MAFAIGLVVGALLVFALLAVTVARRAARLALAREAVATDITSRVAALRAVMPARTG